MLSLLAPTTGNQYKDRSLQNIRNHQGPVWVTLCISIPIMMVFFNDDDRVYAGSGMPDYELGLNFGETIEVLIMNWYVPVGNEIINENEDIYISKKNQ